MKSRLGSSSRVGEIGRLPLGQRRIAEPNRPVTEVRRRRVVGTPGPGFRGEGAQFSGVGQSQGVE